MLPSWQQLIELPDKELARSDSGLNLACTADGRGSYKIDLEQCLRTLARWADHIRAMNPE